MKIDRQKVFDKYNGHCAYCGVVLPNPKRMHVDHIWPRRLSHWYPEFWYPECDENRIDNLNPSCPRCNLFKKGMRLEEFKEELQLQVTRLKKTTAFNRALDFGQIEITEKPIEFYFEKLNKE